MTDYIYWLYKMSRELIEKAEKNNDPEETVKNSRRLVETFDDANSYYSERYENEKIGIPYDE